MQSHDESGSDAARDEPLNGDDGSLRDAVPVCPKCLQPYSPLQHFCRNCGETVGQLTPYIPYINIPFNYSIYRVTWRRAFLEPGVPIASRMLYVLFMVMFVPVLFVGLPFVILEHLRRRRPPGHCRKCGYDLTGNVSGRCPECGEPLPQTTTSDHRSAGGVSR